MPVRQSRADASRCQCAPRAVPLLCLCVSLLDTDTMSLDPANLNGLKVTELKKELKDRGVSLPASAKKSDLIAKLAEVLGIDSTAATAPVDLNDSISELTSSTPAPAVSESAVTAPLAAAAITPSAASLSSVTPANGSSQESEAVLTTESGDAVTVSPAKAIVKVAGGDVKDRLAARAARFGGSATSTPTPAVSIGSGETLAALKKRTERFGEAVSSTVKSLEAKEKLNQRASRFNLSAEEQNPTTTLGLVRKVKSSPIVESAKRPITASTPEEEERIRKRRERFGLT